MPYEFRLAPGQRSILANFDFTHQAQECAEALHAAGFNAVQIDRISRYPHETRAGTARPTLGGAESNAETVLGGRYGKDSRILLANSGDVGSQAGRHEIHVRGLVLTVLCPDARVDECVQIIERHGGRA